MVDIYLDGEEMLDAEAKTDVAKFCPHMLLDGRVVPFDTAFKCVYSSMLEYGVVIKDHIVCTGNNMIMGKTHHMILERNMELLGFGFAHFPSYHDFKNDVALLNYNNKYPSYSRLTLYCWFDTSSVNNHVRWVMLQTRLTELPYTTNNLRPIMKTYKESFLSVNKWSKIKMSSFVDLMAEREMSAGGYWGACLLNERGNIVRTTKGNLYLIVKEGSGLSVLYVDEESGAYTDSLFDMLDHALHKLRYNVRCVKEFTNRDLQNALEAFVLDSSFGVQLVIGIDNERYSDNNLTSDISATFVKTINSIME